MKLKTKITKQSFESPAEDPSTRFGTGGVNEKEIYISSFSIMETPLILILESVNHEQK